MLLIAHGLLYRGYDFESWPRILEQTRQTGLLTLACEFAFISWAQRNGFDPSRYWRNATPVVRVATGCFFGTFWIGAVAMSAHPLLATLFNIGFAIQIVFALALADRFEADGDSARRLSGFMVAGFVAVAAMTIVHFHFRPPEAVVPLASIIWQASIPGYISVRLFGAACGSVLTLLVVSSLMQRNPNWRRSWIAPAIVFMSGLTVWTGTRAAIVGFLIALAIAVIVFRVRPGMRRVGIVAALILVGALAGPLFAPSGDPAFQLFSSGDYASVENASGGRFGFWHATWTAFLTSPWVGLGPGATAWALPPEIFPHIQPHNFVMQFLVSWGLLGALPAFVLLGIATWKAQAVGRRCAAAIPFVIMLDYLLMTALLDGMLHFAREAMMTMIGFAMIFAIDRQARA